MTLDDRLKRTQYHWILGLRELKDLDIRSPNLDFIDLVTYAF